MFISCKSSWTLNISILKTNICGGRAAKLERGELEDFPRHRPFLVARTQQMAQNACSLFPFCVVPRPSPRIVAMERLVRCSHRQHMIGTRLERNCQQSISTRIYPQFYPSICSSVARTYELKKMFEIKSLNPFLLRWFWFCELTWRSPVSHLTSRRRMAAARTLRPRICLFQCRTMAKVSDIRIQQGRKRHRSQEHRPPTRECLAPAASDWALRMDTSRLWRSYNFCPIGNSISGMVAHRRHKRTRHCQDSAGIWSNFGKWPNNEKRWYGWFYIDYSLPVLTCKYSFGGGVSSGEIPYLLNA